MLLTSAARVSLRITGEADQGKHDPSVSDSNSDSSVMAFAAAPSLLSRGQADQRATSAVMTVRPGSFTAARCLPALIRTANAQQLPLVLPCAATVCMQMQRTFIAAKPDAVNRGLVGAIISKFELKGYKLVALKALVPSRQLAETHYDALKSKPFFNDLVEFICSGPVVAMVWEGKNVVATGRKILGATNPLDSDPSTIRGMYGVDIGRNVCHGSDAEETAKREIALWFKPEELCEWEPTMAKWIYE